jgi:GrpB-like predicted nucleotidyltransferase (UPF0157 family)
MEQYRVMSSVRPLVVAYDPGWPERAAGVISSLTEAFGSLADRLEHIGSTAIYGMAAKDVLDIQVGVPDLELAGRELDPLLGALSFRRSPYETDHVPAGRTDDAGDWAKRLWLRRDHPGGDVNLHVRRTGSPNERLALLFRDWFRAHLDAVPAYAAFKTALAEVCPDIDTYSDVKDPVVDLVVSVAEAWAGSVDWAPSSPTSKSVGSSGSP